MSLAFILATGWSVLCSTVGSLSAAALTRACPSCAPVLHCPALTCACGSRADTALATSGAPCAAATSCLQWVVASYVAGLVTAAVAYLGFSLRAAEARGAGRAATPQVALAARGAVASTSELAPRLSPARRPQLLASAGPVALEHSLGALLGPAAPTAASCSSGASTTSVAGEELAVWKPRRA